MESLNPYIAGGIYRFDPKGRTPQDAPELTPEESDQCCALIHERMRTDPDFRKDVLKEEPGRDLGKLPLKAQLGFAAVAVAQLMEDAGDRVR